MNGPSPPAAATRLRVPLAVFALSLLVTGALAMYLAHAFEQGDRAAFETEVTRSVDAVHDRVNSTVTLLRGTAGLFAASGEVSRDEFGAYVDRLRLRERYPGILGIGYSRRVAAAELPAVQAELRQTWGPAFRIWPDTPRAELHTIAYLEPLDERNGAALGFDMYTQPVRQAAMAAARDSGVARASGKVTLVQEIDADKQSGFLIYLPLYRTRRVPAELAGRREQLRGFVYSPLRVGDLLRGVDGRGVRLVDLQVYDGATPAPGALMLSTRDADAGTPRFVTERELDVEGRPWLLRVSSRPSFEAQSRQRWVPWLALVAIGASLGLAAISWVQARARHAAEVAGQQRRLNEAALRASEERERVRSQRLRELAEATPRLNAVATLDAVVVAIESEARRLLGAPDATLRFDGVVDDRAGLALPLDGAEGEAGEAVLHVAPRAGAPYGEDDRLLLRHLGGIASIAVRNARLLGELRDNDRRKDEFLAILAHELRNPLAPLRTSLEILRRAPPGEQAQRALVVAERQTAHMVRLIDDLLDVSRISRGTIVLRHERAPVTAALEAALETARPVIEGRHHRLTIGTVDASLVVHGDPTRLAQIFANLLLNAAHYTPPGGEIDVAVRREGGFVNVSVRDNGIGIDRETLPHVFELFMQAERSIERSGGLGIGLTLVRRLAELHGGTVRAHSAGRGRGSEFVVCLPLAVGSEAEPPGPATSAAGHDAPTLDVLVVDDNRDAAESLAQMLVLDGHRVVLAHDGLQALQVAATSRPDVVLLDIGLPGIDGYEVARRLRRAEGGERLRLVAVTGWGQEDDRRRAQDAGFDVHMVKPIDYATLAGHLRRLFPGD